MDDSGHKGKLETIVVKVFKTFVRVEDGEGNILLKAGGWRWYYNDPEKMAEAVFEIAKKLKNKINTFRASIYLVQVKGDKGDRCLNRMWKLLVWEVLPRLLHITVFRVFLVYVRDTQSMIPGGLPPEEEVIG